MTTIRTTTPVKAVTLTAALADYATCPAGKVWTVRQIIGNSLSATAGVRLELQLWQSAGATYVIYDGLPALGNRIYEVRALMVAGDKVRARGSTAGAVVLTVTVWEFDA